MHDFKLTRNGLVVAAVLLLHLVVLWALQSGLLRRTIEVVQPVTLLSEWVTPPSPKVNEPPPPTPSPKVLPPKRNELPPPAPLPPASPDPTPAPNAVMGTATPQPPLPPVAAPVAVNNTSSVPAAPPAPPAPARIELPSSDADYLQNPKPVYPRLSRSLGEQGKVLVRVLIGVDGKPQQHELRQSSGYERLDQAAIQAVMQWRFVPGKRGGVPEAMWYVVPIHFELK